MSFRDKVELLEPEEIRAELRESIEKMLRKYRLEKSMRYEWIDEFLLKKKGVTKDFKKEFC